MKFKFVCTLLSFFIISSAAFASDRIHVSAVEEFNTTNPKPSLDVKVLEDSYLGAILLKEGDVIHCNVVKITNPKRGKRSASFVVCPISYTTEENTKTIEQNYYGKYASKAVTKEELRNIDAVKVGKKAAITVGNHFVKGVAPVASLAEGMIKNEENNRLESGIKQVYKDSALSYIEKGADLTIEPEDKFYLIFKPSQSKKASDIEQEAEMDD